MGVDMGVHDISHGAHAVDKARATVVARIRRGSCSSRGHPAYLWVFLGGLVANMFAGNAYLLGLPTGLDRPLFLIAGILLVLDPATDRLRARPVFFVMVACVGWTAWSWAATGGIRETTKAFALTDRVAVPLAMFALGALIFTTPARRELLLKTLTILGLYLGVTALGEISSISALVWPHWILDPGLGIQFGRARGPFLYSEPMGMTGALCLFAAGVLAHLRVGGWRWVAVASMGCGVTTVLLSLTRTAWLSTLIAGVVIMLVVPRLRRWLPVAVVTGVVGGAVVLAVFPALGADLGDRLATQRSVYDRALTNAAAVRVVDDHPLLGVGWGRFVAVSPDYVRQADSYPLTNTNIEVHNVFLARAAETGIPGAVLWALAVLLGPVRSIVGRAPTSEQEGWRVLAFAALVVWLLPSLLSPNNYPLPNNLIWLTCGIAGRHYLVAPRAQPVDQRSLEAIA